MFLVWGWFPDCDCDCYISYTLRMLYYMPCTKCMYVCMHANMDVCECDVVSSLHPTNPRLSLIFIQRRRAQMVPPFEQHRAADEFEPWRKDEPRLLEHLLQLVRRHIPRIAHFVRVNL